MLDLIAKHNASQAAGIIRNFVNNVEYLEKSFADELEKGKKANIGEIREWGGEKYKKQVEGWVRVTDGKLKVKMEQGDVDKNEAIDVAKNKKGGAAKNIGLGLFNDDHLFKKKRAEHTSESLTKSVVDILNNKKLSSPDKVVELFEEGLEIHEVVNVTGTPLSATIDYINKAKRNGQLGKNKVQAQPKEEEPKQKIQSEETDKNTESEEKKSEIDLDEIDLKEQSIEKRFKSYKLLGTMIALRQARSLFVYGSGGVGKTFTLLDKEDGIFSRLKLRKGEINPNLDAVDENGAAVANQGGNSPDSLVGINPQTQERFLKKDKYDYITITGKLSPVRMFELMQEHNGKILVFDDCDSVLQKGDDGVNTLKGALDTSGDGLISWEGRGALRSRYAGIAGASPLLNNKGEKTGVYELPRTFQFNGQVVFISNMKEKEIPQPIMSRAMMIDLTMNREETLKKVKEIAPLVKFTTPGGASIIDVSQENRKKAVDFMEKHINRISEADLNMRTFIKIASIYHTAEALGTPEDAEDTALNIIKRKNTNS